MQRGSMILGLALLLAVAAGAQQTGQPARSDDPQREEHVTQMMQDSATMRILVDRIAQHPYWHHEMMGACMRHADRDSTFRRDMMQAMMENREMHRMMMEGMPGERKGQEGQRMKEGDTTRTREQKQEHRH